MNNLVKCENRQMIDGQKEKSVKQESRQDRAGQLFLTHLDYVRTVAFMNAPTPCLTDDIVNDCYIEFVNKAEKWDLESPVTPLLARMTRNIALRYWREHSRQMPDYLQRLYSHLQERWEQEVDMTDVLAREQVMAAMNLCMAKLTAENRQIIRRHYYKKTKLVDLAKEMGKKVQTLRNLVFRIRGALKKCIEGALSGGQCHVE